jgi:hypothetical protein
MTTTIVQHPKVKYSEKHQKDQKDFILFFKKKKKKKER